jgi:DNA polymerase-1
MGPSKLSHTVEITMGEAKKLMEAYFKAFPSIKAFLERLGNFGVKKGYSRTFPPYNRKRFYPYWRGDGSMENKMRGMIERASKNHPIQGTSADITKLAMGLIREDIRGNSLPVKMVMTVHDEVTTICKKEFAEEWKARMTGHMEAAAKRVIKNGLLKSDTQITDKWSK